MRQNVPTRITLKREKKTLEICFNDGSIFDLSAEFLRVFSPSAEVQGHSPEERQVISGRRHVGIVNIEPVGQYAIRIHFDDTHDTGIFSWDILYQFGIEQEAMWVDYMEELGELNLTRDP